MRIKIGFFLAMIFCNSLPLFADTNSLDIASNIRGYIIFFILLHSIICAFFATWLAEEKGLSSGLWFVIGLLTGIIGLITIAGMPAKSKIINVEPSLSSRESVTWVCPQCSESNLNQTFTCGKCNYSLR